MKSCEQVPKSVATIYSQPNEFFSTGCQVPLLKYHLLLIYNLLKMIFMHEYCVLEHKELELRPFMNNFDHFTVIIKYKVLCKFCKQNIH